MKRIGRELGAIWPLLLILLSAAVGLFGQNGNPSGAFQSGAPNGVFTNVKVNGGQCTGSVTQFGFPTCDTVTIAGQATDIASRCDVDSNLIGQLVCHVMKSTGQTEVLYGNAGCVGDAQVNVTGTEMDLGPVSASGTCDNNLKTLNGNIHLAPGTAGNVISLDGPISTSAASIVSTGTVIPAAGTGACPATFATQFGGGVFGVLLCTGAGGAGTITFTPGSTHTAWFCTGYDVTTGTAVVKQSTYTSTTCVLSITGAGVADVITYFVGGIQ